MSTVLQKVFFAQIHITTLLIVFNTTNIHAQITINQSEFIETFTPGNPLHTIEGESGTVNIGNVGGPNIYDFTFVDMQDTFMIFNYEVSTIPILAARYPSNAHTIGLNPSF